MLDKQINPENVAVRLMALEKAAEFVKPIVEQHPLEKYSVGAAFSTAATYTPCDQHLTSILTIADWLIEA